MVLKYQRASEFPGGLIKTLVLDHILEFPVQRSGIGLESCFLRNFQVMLLLLVLGPHFEDHWIRASLVCYIKINGLCVCWGVGRLNNDNSYPPKITTS